MNRGEGKQGSGLAVKLHWRPTDGSTFHCYWRIRDRYVALCDRAVELTRIGGGAISRPPPMMRCAICDGREMELRGHDESLDERGDWRRTLEVWTRTNE